MAGRETVFQPICLEFLPRETKAQSEEERGGWGTVGRVVFKSGAKTWLRYIPVSQSRYIAKSNIKVMDAQSVDIPQIYGKQKKVLGRDTHCFLSLTVMNHLHGLLHLKICF